MKVCEIAQFGLEGLTIAERPEPTVKPYHIVIKMRAASLNFRDLMTVQGLYNPKQPLPLIPCSDGVGEVVVVGDSVSRVKVGDRVATIFAQGWLDGHPTKTKLATTLGGPYDGTLTEYMLLHENGVVTLPAHLTDIEAATLPCAALTAWSALVVYGDVKAGDTVLVQGTGGVSIFALQFANLLGAKVIVTSSSDEKLAKARELGAWQTINYKTTPDWDKRARELTDGQGVDHIVEVGGAGTLEKALRAIAFAGQISVIGVLSGSTSKLNIIPILMQNVKAQGIIVGSRTSFEAMNRAIAAHQLKPVVDKTFEFAQIRESLEYMASGSHFGKITIQF